MSISTKVLFFLTVLTSFFSCARREQALYQRTQREYFAQSASSQASVSQPTNINPVAETNEPEPVKEPEVLSASLEKSIPVSEKKVVLKKQTTPTTAEERTVVDQTNKPEKKAQPRRSFLKKLATEPGQTSGLAIAALVCGIVSFFILGIVLGPLAVIFGAVALNKIHKNPEIKGRGLAVAGLVIGIVGTILTIIFLASR